MTVGQQIAKSLKLIGVLASGEDAPANIAADCLETFSAYLDWLSTQRLSICNQERSEYSTVAGTSLYTVGSGGTFDQTRPVWLDGVGLLITGQEYPLRPLTQGEYQRWPDKTLQTLPGAYYFNDAYPLGELTLLPVPDAVYTVALYWPSSALTAVTDTATVLSVPPGWDRMLTYGLAREFGVLFGVPLRREIGEIADQTLADVKRTNIRPEVLTFDTALSGHRPYVTRATFDGGDF